MGRDIVQKPACPFCGMHVERPRELSARMAHEMPVGTCSCGAVYAYDATGHNLGTAMIEALVFGCNGDWDLAWDLLPGEDYLEEQVKDYDLDAHLIVPGGAYQGRGVFGSLYFIRLQEDVLEVTEEGARRRLERATPVAPKKTGRKRAKKRFSKRDIENLVREYKVEPILALAGEDHRIIRDLQRLLYSADNRLRWRAAEILGKVSELIAKSDPGAISKLLKVLFTSLTDTAASSWGALDAIGEIVCHNVDQFSGYAPQLFQFLRDRALLAEVLRALGRIARERPESLRNKAFHFVPLLNDPDPEIRGYAAVLLGNLGAPEARDDLENLKTDSSPMDIYGDGEILKKTVGELASEALEML